MPSRKGKALCALAFSALVLTVVARPAYAYGGLPAANLLDFFEYKFDIDAGQLFPSRQAQQDVINAGHPQNYTIGKIDQQIMGFAVSATDVRIKVSPSKIDTANTRLGVDIEGRNVAIDSSYLHKKYGLLQVDSIYGVYNSRTDRVTVHVPFSTALSLLFK